MTPQQCREELLNAPTIDALRTAIQSVEDDLEKCRGHSNVEERRIGYAIRDGLGELLGSAIIKASGPSASAMSIRLARESREDAETQKEAA